MHLIGVDLGRQNDFAAPVIFEDELILEPVTIMPDGVPPRYQDVPTSLMRIYNLVDMCQWRGVSYPIITRRIKDITISPLISRDYILVVDATGVGIAVIDMMRELDLFPIGITITGGNVVTLSEFGYNVPKRDIVVNMQVVFQCERIRIAAELALATTFRDQLKHYTTPDKLTARGKQTFGNDAEVGNDDLVTSAGIVLWYAEKVLGSVVQLPTGKEKEYNPAKAGLS